ncbi:hypothetical protein B5K08_05570 [Rhizobium leguminosarum bv. trifolii]|uniref:Uncharacterized protein n=1 Tax=Rhizobium leguminosarum bv. trifolii TaxID=386 RepID=A0A3E1BXG2_RHILT|nr:hypothetical protein [Rhizobium leguminosarum]RFB98018.1 hypothetical protein B5K08_05570 [Rhizobium leguminosarum bv. trifolii]RFB99971.1 hypothetical protein B5K10_05560 [Rhizobium leguminosarum bv. trifolii]
MNTRNHHISSRADADIESLLDYFDDSTSEPRQSLAQILRSLEREVVAPTGEKRCDYILRWELPRNFFQAENGKLERVRVYHGFKDKLRGHDVVGLGGDIAEHVKGPQKSAWRMIFCHAILGALLEGREDVETKAAA